jgi:hypothetical protein
MGFPVGDNTSDAGGGGGEQVELATEDVHEAVVAEVIEVGEEEREYKGKTTTNFVAKIIYQVDEASEDGGRKEVHDRLRAFTKREDGQWYPVWGSAAKVKSTMRKRIEGILGTAGLTIPDAVTNDQLNELLEECQGRPCRVKVIHRTGKDGRIWPNVEFVMPSKNPIELEDYTNWDDREFNKDAGF